MARLWGLPGAINMVCPGATFLMALGLSWPALLHLRKKKKVFLLNILISSFIPNQKFHQKSIAPCTRQNASLPLFQFLLSQVYMRFIYVSCFKWFGFEAFFFFEKSFEFETREWNISLLEKFYFLVGQPDLTRLIRVQQDSDTGV